jgi:hypothetical protein
VGDRLEESCEGEGGDTGYQVQKQGMELNGRMAGGQWEGRGCRVGERC